MDMLKAFTSEQLKTEVPVFNVGDTVRCTAASLRARG